MRYFMLVHIKHQINTILSFKVKIANEIELDFQAIYLSSN